MSDTTTVSIEQPAGERAAWITPDVSTMIAGHAENGSGTVQDDPFSNS